MYSQFMMHGQKNIKISCVNIQEERWLKLSRGGSLQYRNDDLTKLKQCCRNEGK